MPRAVLGTLTSFLALSATPTFVESAQAGGCAPSHVRTYAYQVNSSISGIGGFWQCSGIPRKATIQLQQYRGLTYWRTLKTYTGSFTPNRYVRLSWGCRGAGWQTYRTMMSGRTAGGDPWVTKSAEIRRLC
jgi:hypothetical protein